MISTSEERREVAERLRKNADKRGVSLDYLGSTQVASWWLLLHTIGCNSNEQESVFRMLADLIDPTCHVREYGHHDELRVVGCSVCRFGWLEDVHGIPNRFCPYCGARVVDGGRA